MLFRGKGLRSQAFGSRLRDSGARVQYGVILQGLYCSCIGIMEKTTMGLYRIEVEIYC